LHPKAGFLESGLFLFRRASAGLAQVRSAHAPCRRITRRRRRRIGHGV